MKQKIVIKVEMECERCRSKALALVAGTGGVDSVALAGDARDQFVVVGDGVDSIKLATALRRKVGPAHILKLDTEANMKKQEDGAAKKKPAAAVPPPELASSLWYYQYQYPPPQQQAVYEQPATGYPYAYGCQSQTRPDSVCSIM